MNTEYFWKIAIIVLYIIGNIAIGWWSARKVKNVGDFFIAGRKVGPWLSAFAFGTSYFSAVLFIGYAGKLGWGYGMHTLWIAIGNALVGTLLSWMFLAKRTREMTTRLDTITMPEFLGTRYDLPALRNISALVVFLFLIPYSASVYQGLGSLFEATLGVGYLQAVVFLALLTGIYLLMGGYLAVAITDAFHGVLQFVGVFVMVYLICQPAGGFVAAVTGGMRPENTPQLYAAEPLPGGLILGCLVLITSLGVWGMPQMVQKFYSIKRLVDIKPAMILSTVFALVMSFGAYFTGATSRLLLTGVKLAFDPSREPDKIVPYLLEHNVPSWWSVLILLLVLAASMSVLASLVLVSSAAISVDLFGLRSRGEGADRKGVTVLRILCGIFVGVSVVIATNKFSFIVNMMAFSWGALAGFFLAPYLYGLFWKRGTSAAAVVSGLVGLATSILVPVLWRFQAPGPDGQMILIPVAKSPAIPVASALAMVLPLIVFPLVSLMTRPPRAEAVARAFGDDEAAPQLVNDVAGE